MSVAVSAARPEIGLPDFRQVFDASPQPLLLLAADPPRFTMLAVNAAHARAFSTTPEALIGWGVLEVFGENPEPEPARFRDAIRESMDRVVATRAPDQMPIRPYAVTLPSGAAEERYWSAANAPVLGPDGAVTHIVSAVRDATGEVLERRSEEARTLLMREVDHRARNALTVVQSFVRLTDAPTLEDFRQVLDGRVEALARAQTSLAARRWEGATLAEVIEAELASLSDTGKARLSGPHTLLAAEDVQAMSMAIHELATNANKYGALASPGGELDVTWTVDADGRLSVIWDERCGRPVVRPTREGFGTRLIAQLAKQLRGEIAYDWRPTGLKAELRAFKVQ